MLPKDKGFVSRIVGTQMLQKKQTAFSKTKYITSIAHVVQNILFSSTDSWHANKNMNTSMKEKNKHYHSSSDSMLGREHKLTELDKSTLLQKDNTYMRPHFSC